MDVAPVLEGHGVRLSPLTADDIPALTQAASDPGIWEQHPNKERGTPEGFAPYIAQMLAGGGMLVARRGEAVIGMSRYYEAPEEPGTWCIGYTFLIRAEWGGATNRAMKALMLDHAFQTQESILFHIAEENLRSQRATRKIGAVFIDDNGFGNTSKRYRLTRETWQKQ